ncbi:MAG: hypothetical protein ACOC93_00950 [Planctomycetota bacterium]
MQGRTAAEIWHWLVRTDGGMWARIAGGSLVFSLLALWDLRRNGPSARRWREYAFLLLSVAAAIVYGIVNDQITVTLSPHYFVYYKGGLEAVGYNWAETPLQLRWQAVGVGVRATWWMGLIIGAVVLLVNSYPRRWPALPVRQLARLLPAVLVLTASLAAMAGLIGYLRPADWIRDYPPITVGDVNRFGAAWMIHAGGYLGGLAATAWAAQHLLRRRRRKA